jgi:hypothetical protein
VEGAFIGPQEAKMARRARNNLKRKHRGAAREQVRRESFSSLDPLLRFLLVFLSMVLIMGFL